MEGVKVRVREGGSGGEMKGGERMLGKKRGSSRKKWKREINKVERKGMSGGKVREWWRKGRQPQKGWR